MARLIQDDVEVKIADKIVAVALRKGARTKRFGVIRASHINNMIKGVTTGFEKSL